MRFALAGNTNSGKTTLFNNLTGSSAHVGNWPGVTVDRKEGTYRSKEGNVDIIDLPGIYSLSPYTPEEVVSRNYLMSGEPDLVINILDATNLESSCDHHRRHRAAKAHQERKKRSAGEAEAPKQPVHEERSSCHIACVLHDGYK